MKFHMPTIAHSARMLQTRAMPKHQHSTIFQMTPPCGQVTLEDVDDIYPICNNIRDREHRYACYACYGMDMEKVEKYYPIVKSLQSQMKPETMDATVFRVSIGRLQVIICINK